jgi:hypothetical protein
LKKVLKCYFLRLFAPHWHAPYLLEEYGPKIVYIKGIHNTITDAISWIEYDPSVNLTAESYFITKVKSLKCSQRQNWMAV